MKHPSTPDRIKMAAVTMIVTLGLASPAKSEGLTIALAAIGGALVGNHFLANDGNPLIYGGYPVSYGSQPYPVAHAPSFSPVVYAGTHPPPAMPVQRPGFAVAPIYLAR